MIGKKWKKKLELMAPSGILDLDTLIKEGWEIHPKTIAFKCTGPARSRLSISTTTTQPCKWNL